MQPQTVTATIYANAAPPFASTVVRWRANGGSFQDLPMASQGNHVTSTVFFTTWSGDAARCQPPTTACTLSMPVTCWA